MEQIQLGERNYKSLYNILRAYRMAGGNNDTIASEFNRFDNPGTLYFRIFFDFQKGLLDCIHDVGSQPQMNRDDFWNKNTIIHNSALNYLTINNEWERADMLREFISLLSNISVNSPWYFMGLEGLGEVLDRSEFTADAFALQEMKSVAIKCMPDSYDQRIGTLLDLYRAICYSYQLHKEIVPANLRRFNMYVYIFPAMKRGIHAMHKYENNSYGETKTPVDHKFATFDQNSIYMDKQTGDVSRDTYEYLTSSKLILLKGCEIDINACKSGYENVSNEEGFVPTYTIPIKVRWAEEQRYNEFLMKLIGDYVIGDMDTPGSNEDSAGNPRDVVWSKDDANNLKTVKDFVGDFIQDTRIEKDIRTGRINNDDAREDIHKQTNNEQETFNSLGRSVYRDEHKSSLLDPWTNMGKQVAGQLMDQASQVFNAGKSALSSWTDLRKLSGNAATAVGGLVNRLLFGNIFETSLQDVTTSLSSGIAGLSSGNVIDEGIRGKGWTYRNRDNGSISRNPRNIFDSY